MFVELLAEGDADAALTEDRGHKIDVAFLQVVERLDGQPDGKFVLRRLLEESHQVFTEEVLSFIHEEIKLLSLFTVNGTDGFADFSDQ